MMKGVPIRSPPLPGRKKSLSKMAFLYVALIVAATAAISYSICARWGNQTCCSHANVIGFRPSQSYYPYGRFPMPGDPFKFIPCTNSSLLPSLDDTNPRQTWAALYDPNPLHWSWGTPSQDQQNTDILSDPHANRGIYLCGYLDLPLNTFNDSEERIVRIAITKYQVSGLVPVSRQAGIQNHDANSPQKRKSSRTIIIRPGGPGVSGTGQVWSHGEILSERYSNGQYDVLGWDSRGVNASLPSFSCSPHDSYRDRWAFFKAQYREEVASPKQHLRLYDAMNNAMFYACHKIHGDFGRFIGKTFSAIDLEGIRNALDEDEVTGYFVGYGAAIGVAYARMFPRRVGRMLLDATQYARDQWKHGSCAPSSLYNVDNIWREGFLRKCLDAGPAYCALAKRDGESTEFTTFEELETRMRHLFQSLIEHPLLGDSPTSGPGILTYSQVVSWIYTRLYEPKRWPLTAQILHDLELDDTKLAMENIPGRWYNNTYTGRKESSEELFSMAVCANAFDDPPPEHGLGWWDNLWASASDDSWIAGSFRFTEAFACRHYQAYWPKLPEVYLDSLGHGWSNTVLVISGKYDPATPLKNGQDLVADLRGNARLIVHHGYGHVSSSHLSECTDGLGRDYILYGSLPWQEVMHCFPNQKPYHARVSYLERDYDLVTYN